jgi:ankyrin repeat protein
MDLIKSIQNLLQPSPTIISYYNQPPTDQATLERLLAQAVEDENTTLVRELLHCRVPADVNLRGKQCPDETALQHAVRRGYGDIMRLLLKAGANPNARPSGQKTALQVAVDHDDIEVARILLKAGADPNYTEKTDDTHYSDTALQRAAWRMNTRMVELLLLP